jgi:hypothetical protein
MKNNLNEELNRLKFLLGYKPGQLMTESQVKRTYLNEHDPLGWAVKNAVELGREGFFQMDFSNWAESMKGDLNFYQARGVIYNEQKFSLKFSSVLAGLGGGWKSKTTIPGTQKPPISVPGQTFTFNANNQFGNNLITPTSVVVKQLEEEAKRLVEIMNKVYLTNGRDKNAILKFLGNGFIIEGHADGSPPSFVDATITADHQNNGFNIVFDGITNLFQRNDWLATQRAKVSYNIFLNTIKNSAPRLAQVFTDKSLMDKIMGILKLNDNGGKSILRVVNHLNQDGSANPAEIGPTFRRMDFIPQLTSSDSETTFEPTPPKEKINLADGTYIGLLTLPIFRGQQDEKFSVPGVQLKMEGQPGLFWGVDEETMIKYKNILPVITPTEFNGKSKVAAVISGRELIIDNIDMGTIYKASSANALEQYKTTGRLCVDRSLRRPQMYKEKKYYPVMFYEVTFHQYELK